MQKLRPKSPDGANSPSFYSSPPITTFDHTQISLLPVPKFQPASGKPRPRAGVLKLVSPNFCPKSCSGSRCYSNLTEHKKTAPLQWAMARSSQKKNKNKKLNLPWPGNFPGARQIKIKIKN